MPVKSQNLPMVYQRGKSHVIQYGEPKIVHDSNFVIKHYFVIEANVSVIYRLLNPSSLIEIKAVCIYVSDAKIRYM